MAEVVKRNKRVQILDRLYRLIKAEREDATLAKLTVWRAQVDRDWEAFEELHNAVLNRTGASEVTEQNQIFDDAYTYQYKCNVMLEELSNRLNPLLAPPPDQEDNRLVLLQRRHAYQKQLFEAAFRLLKNWRPPKLIWPKHL